MLGRRGHLAHGAVHGLRREIQREIVLRLQFRGIHHGSSQLIRQHLDHRGNGLPVRHQAHAAIHHHHHHAVLARARRKLRHAIGADLQAVHRRTGSIARGRRRAGCRRSAGSAGSALRGRGVIVDRLLQFRTALADHQGVHGKLLGLVMQREFEALRQQILQHQLELLFCGARGDLGDDVEAFAIQPFGTVQLIPLDVVSRSSGHS